MLLRLAPPVLLCVLCTFPIPALAQNTRAEELERQRTEKSAQLHEYEPGRLEKLLLYVDRNDPMGRLAPQNGFFVRYGYYDKAAGSGIGFGGGYRRDLFDRRARVVGEGGITFRNYQVLRGDFSLPHLAHDLVEVGVEGTRRHMPQEDFYGIGSSSLEDDRATYRLDTTAVVARAVVRPRTWLSAGVHAGRLSPSVGTSTDVNFPLLETRFTDVDAPGLAVQPDFRSVDVFAVVDYRDHPGNARAGGYYALTVGSYRDLDLDRYGFGRVDLHVQQFFPVFDKKRVFAVQGRVITSTADDGRQVPFYMQPTIGGSTTLRSVSDFRFRDDNLLYLNVEYRWEAVGGLDMALFTDLAKVAAAPHDLDLSDLKRAYGIGLRFNTYRSVFLRLDVGAGSGEGIHYYVKFSKAF